MSGTLEARLELPNPQFPLIVLVNHGDKDDSRHYENVLHAPYEAYPRDRATLWSSPSIPSTVHLQLVSQEGDRARHLLLSNVTDGRKLITMSGYHFTGPVEVYSWKAKGNIEAAYPNEATWMEIVRQIEMEHVYGLARAIGKHRERVVDLSLKEMTLADAVAIYTALQNTIPS